MRLSAAKWRDVKRVFLTFGIAAVEGRSAGHRRKRHPMLVDGSGRKYPIPARKESDDIYRVYIEAARRRFNLTPEYGISDEDFYSRF